MAKSKKVQRTAGRGRQGAAKTVVQSPLPRPKRGYSRRSVQVVITLSREMADRLDTLAAARPVPYRSRLIEEILGLPLEELLKKAPSPEPSILTSTAD